MKKDTWSYNEFQEYHITESILNQQPIFEDEDFLAPMKKAQINPRKKFFIYEHPIYPL